jgi:hypothetical protein
MPASPVPLRKLRGLLFGYKLLHFLEHDCPFGQVHSQRFHGEFLPFERIGQSLGAAFAKPEVNNSGPVRCLTLYEQASNQRLVERAEGQA